VYDIRHVDGRQATGGDDELARCGDVVIVFVTFCTFADDGDDSFCSADTPIGGLPDIMCESTLTFGMTTRRSAAVFCSVPKTGVPANRSEQEECSLPMPGNIVLLLVW